MMVRLVALLYLSGVGLMLLALALPHDGKMHEVGVAVLAGATAAVGGALLLFARRARTWTLHAALAGGSLQAGAAVYLSGIGTGVFALMFIWVAIVAAFCFSRRIAGAHLAFLLTAYAVGLAAVESEGFPPLTRWLLTAFALLAPLLAVSWLVEGLDREEAQRADAEMLARTDDLTGLPNRRWLYDELGREMARAERQGFEIWAAVIDLDHFKSFNDRFGHLAGDHFLIEAGNEWRSVLRVSDFLARSGGEEFVLLLPDCSAHVAAEVIDRVRAATPLAQTCSVGYARWDRQESGSDLIGRADRALYEAKAAGRDRAVSAEPQTSLVLIPGA